METAYSVINDALQAIAVQASEQTIEAVDFQIARRYLNRMMSVTPFVGLGFTQVTKPEDPVTIPDAALEGVISNLAKRLLPAYDLPLTAELNMAAVSGLKEIRRLTVKILPSSHPCTLPVGSGNEYDYTLERFYNCPEDEILTEQGGSILVESNN